MMNKSEQNNDKVSDVLNKLLFDHYYSIATEEACKGDYSLASSYISDLIKSNGENPILLDLQAKINAQQGKLKEAEFLWKKCIKADPDNNTYIAALNRVCKLQESKIIKHFTLLKLVGAIAGLLILACLLIAVLFSTIEKSSKIAELQEKQADILELIDNSFKNKGNVFADSLIAEIANKVNLVNGTSIRKNNNELVITFNEGLFSNGTKFKLSQEPIVKQLAEVLEPYSAKISITVFGCTDNMPIDNSDQYQSNNALSIARANFVYDIIFRTSRIPIESLIIGGTSENNSPFPNDSRESKMRNRTVVIKIIQKI